MIKIILKLDITVSLFTKYCEKTKFDKGCTNDWHDIKKVLRALANRKNSDRTAYLHSLIRVFPFCVYSQPSLSRLRLSRITAYLEEKIWSLF